MLATGYPTEEDGSYFIDRSPKYFSVIMDFLRYDELPEFEGWTSMELERLKKEFEFFKIPLVIAPKYTQSDILFLKSLSFVLLFLFLFVVVVDRRFDHQEMWCLLAGKKQSLAQLMR